MAGVKIAQPKVVSRAEWLRPANSSWSRRKSSAGNAMR
jgi:hypothetical protein